MAHYLQVPEMEIVNGYPEYYTKRRNNAVRCEYFDYDRQVYSIGAANSQKSMTSNDDFVFPRRYSPPVYDRAVIGDAHKEYDVLQGGLYNQLGNPNSKTNDDSDEDDGDEYKKRSVEKKRPRRFEHIMEKNVKGYKVQHKAHACIPTPKELTKESLTKWAKKGLSPDVSKSVKIKTSDVGTSASALVGMIDTIDRPPSAEAKSKYASAGKYAYCSNETGKRIPKAGLVAEAGVGKATAEFSIFAAEAKGPNAQAALTASATGVAATATAGLGTASASAGPLTAKVGLQLDTGVTAGVDGISATFLGCGVSLGPKTGVSILGNEISVNCSLM